MLDLIIGLHLLTYHDDPVWKPAKLECDSAAAFIVRRCHVEPERRYDGENPGLYLVDRSSGFGAGFYRNSEARWSVHWDWTMTVHPNIDLSFGVVTGYERAPILPFVSVGFHAGPVRVSFIPGPAVHLSLEFRQ